MGDSSKNEVFSHQNNNAITIRILLFETTSPPLGDSSENEVADIFVRFAYQSLITIYNTCPSHHEKKNYSSHLRIPERPGIYATNGANGLYAGVCRQHYFNYPEGTAAF